MRVVLLTAVASMAVACAGGSESADSTATSPTSSIDDGVDDSVADDFSVLDEATTTTTLAPPERFPDGPLSEVCPQRIVVQTGGLPNPAVGPLFALLPPEAAIDVATQTVAGPLVRPDGTVEDVVLEIRSGGPSVDFENPLALLDGDNDILLAQVSTAIALRDAAALPSIGVVTLTDRSHDAIIVDPMTYPEATTFAVVRSANIEVRHVTDEAFIEFLVATGELAAEQLVSGFDREPAAFVGANGAIAQQGDLLIDPLLFPSLAQWNRPVVALDAADVGWAVHDDSLVARPSDVDDRAECFGRLVPVIQAGIARYMDSPQSVDALMSAARTEFAPLARLTGELMDAGVGLGIERGVFGDGSNATVGDFDTERLDGFLPLLADAYGMDSVAVDDLMTNEFIDPALTAQG